MSDNPRPAPSDVMPGDSVQPGRPVTVNRYTVGARINHWITAISLILLALSGLSLFTPSLFFLTNLFGGGQLTRAIHPWIGVVLFFSFSILFIRFWRANLPKREDVTWVARSGDVLMGHEERLPELGKYNAGQKVVFWGMSALIIVLIVSGLIVWERYFFTYTSIPTQRVALIVHSLAAVGIICIWIIHVYAAIWVKGTMSAMTSGKVTGGWAWRHHRKWLRELVAGKRAGGTPAE
ncbi:formate dehydrogenase gamma subunit [Azorhizobium caulinodans ORS 571]|uniref:Formate dehydrogenase gamma subunit n=1 Tax=Azorhizobium caulinodans (strain ATCC 43989 / DSM 5975 / JCM 20966 / LMG 6465 / NBRC 14845 / NCIMB 13405 / ORS 571) TaxID=438753 RepID=A8HRB0_AZOC5|nr:MULTISPECIES: formate dehydrogenase subunit gamma [Azorhizobium]TDT92633.1 formate dehydrogenase subunit gamma [Azorhizobium sp. AG788]BAF87155.1 formate dehydrogenase gamma subunit [Azorhizobium caulinodans ORS 571]